MQIDEEKLKQAFKNTSQVRYKNAENDTGIHQFSDDFENKMKNVIERKKQKKFRFFAATSRRAACIIAAVFILSASTITINAVLNSHDFDVKRNDEYVIIRSDMETRYNYPLEIEDEYVLGKVPDGYTLKLYDDLDDHINSLTPPSSFEKTFYTWKDDDYIEYKYYTDDKDDDKDIVFTQETKARFFQYCPKDVTKTEFFKDGSQEYLYVTSEDFNEIVWDCGDYILYMQSNLTKDEMLDLCKTTKLREK